MTTSTQRLATLAVMAVVLATLGCNSTQPDQESAQTVTLTFTASANVEDNDCYAIWVDFDDPPNGTGEEDSGQVWCYSIESIESRRVPWNYSLLITKIPAGSTTQELVATSLFPGDAIPDFVSLTAYDQTVQTAPSRAEEGNVVFVPVGRVSRASQIWLTSNLKESNGEFSDISYNLGVPNVLEQPTFTVDLATGDTIIVSARKQSLADGPHYFNQPPGLDQNPELSINANLTVGGSPVQINGSSFSTTDDGAGFTFSYTRQ